MWHHTLIFLPVLGIILDLLNILPTHLSRGLIVMTVSVGLLALTKQPNFKISGQLLKSALASLGGALATFLLSTELNLGPVVTSGLVGLAGAQFLRQEEQVPMYLGAFVGMSSSARFPGYAPLILAGLLGGVFFELLSESWPGVGGRLGTLAAASIVTVLAIGGGF